MDAGTMYANAKALHELLQEARAENEKLREQLDYEHQTSRSRLESVDMLKDENAKLRELVREIWKSCPVSEDDCAECPHRLEEDDEVWCDIPILMEQLGVLGVEVDA